MKAALASYRQANNVPVLLDCCCPDASESIRKMRGETLMPRRETRALDHPVAIVGISS